MGPGARDDIRIVITSPAVIGALLRAPRLMTLVALHIAGHLLITGGSPLDALDRWDHLRAIRLIRSVDRKLILRAAWPFLFARERSVASLDFAPLDFTRKVGALFGRGRDDGALIRHHYDISNEFYALFLDPMMQYSSAVFAAPETSLADAQTAKMDLICRKLRLAPGDRLFDLGCGWGGLACHAASHYGAMVHGVTLSREQYDRAVARVAEHGLGERVRIELRDYRTIDGAGAFDKIAQIEMFEHVGIDNHDAHFRQMHRLLRGQGLYLHQATTRRATPDLRRFRRRTAYTRVINRYIFPGGELDYIGMTVTNLERHGFEIHHVESLREHFSRTLAAWSAALYDRRDRAAADAGAARTRLWLLYFALSGTGFRRGVLGSFQTLAQKRAGGTTGLPPTGLPPTGLDWLVAPV